jgi:hypothetical protein
VCVGSQVVANNDQETFGMSFTDDGEAGADG